MRYFLFDIVLGHLPTAIICLFIVLSAIYYGISLIRISHFKGTLKSMLLKDDFIDQISNLPVTKNVYSRYRKSFFDLDEQNLNKTDEEAENYFHLTSVLDSLKINRKAMAAAAGIFVGLGLFGTFWGLTNGISQFHSGSSQEMQKSIKVLLNGMNTAFLTSLVGMATSILYLIFEKGILNALSRQIENLCYKLDERYFISQSQKYAFISKKQNDLLIHLFSSTDSQGQPLSVSNLIRDIYEENQKQTEAIESFAEELPSQLDNTMNESLKPLVEEVSKVTETLSAKLDSFAQVVKSPGDNMASGIVTDLKEAISTMLDELKKNVSEMTTGKMDGLSGQLETAAQALSSFPSQLETMTSNMNVLVSSIQETVDKMNNQMQSQTETSTTQLAGLATSLETTMTRLNEKTLQTNNAVINRQMESNQQSDMMLESLRDIVGDVNKVLSNVDTTLVQFKELQNKTNIAATNMNEMSRNAVLSTSKFHDAQSTFINDCRRNTEQINETVQLIEESLVKAKDLPDKYVSKFGDINKSLTDIFEELSIGLTKYSETVKESTESTIYGFSNSMAKSIELLSSAIEQMGEAIDDMEETRNKSKKR